MAGLFHVGYLAAAGFVGVGVLGDTRINGSIFSGCVLVQGACCWTGRFEVCKVFHGVDVNRCGRCSLGHSQQVVGEVGHFLWVQARTVGHRHDLGAGLAVAAHQGGATIFGGTRQRVTLGLRFTNV